MVPWCAICKSVWGRLTQWQQQLGNGKLTAAEERTHFGLWAMAKSPIILGNDLSKISNATLAIIKNKVK
jgi:hypothetical protein